MYSNAHTSNGSHGHEFLSGMILGAAVGAAVGLLFAPRAGREVRGQMAAKAERLRREAERTYERASGAVHDVVDRGRHAWDRGRQSFDEARAAHADAAPRTPADMADM